MEHATKRKHNSARRKCRIMRKYYMGKLKREFENKKIVENFNKVNSIER